MNHAKIDAALSGVISQYQALSLEESSLSISVRTANTPTSAQQEELQKLGVRGVDGNGTIFSANVSLKKLDELSNKEYVQLLSLVRPAKPSPCLLKY